jgi:hypothetical protein
MIHDTIEGSLPSLERDTSLIRTLLTLSFRAGESMETGVWRLLCDSAWDAVPIEWYGWEVEEDARDVLKERIAEQSTQAYQQEKWLAVSRFVSGVCEPNDPIHLAVFNELVSGYRLGRQAAWVVRKPARLECDEQGRLHSATRTCIEYADGWGCYAWHGVLVPEKVILAPERLSREDFLKERNMEARRIIQERMGERFLSELGGKLIDEGPRGKLYEVVLTSERLYEMALRRGWPGAQDLAERYIQVQDASTSRQYFVRVPPTIQTAAEAAAWSFQVGVEDYHPAQEM